MAQKIEDINRQLKQAEDNAKHWAEREKDLRAKAKELAEQNRMNRLRKRGELLESFIENADDLTDAQVLELLKVMFEEPAVKEALNEMLSAADASAE